MTTQRKTFTPTSVKADAPGSIQAEFATMNVIDSDQDVTLPGAFGEQTVRIQSHGHDTASWSIGKGTIHEEGDKAVLVGLLNLDMQEGKEGHASLKFDVEHGTPLQEWSYVYEILDGEYGSFQGQRVRFLKSLKVYSVDPVFRGAGVGTRTTGVKSADEDTGGDMSDADRVSLTLIREKLKFDQHLEDMRPHVYLEVPAEDVPSKTLDAVSYLVEHVSPDVLPSGEIPGVRWFKRATPEEREFAKSAPHRFKETPWRTDERVQGLTSKQGVIWILADLEPYEASHTAMHELHHLELIEKRANPKRWVDEHLTRAAEEKAANAFADHIMLIQGQMLDLIIEPPTPAPRQSYSPPLFR